MALIGHFIIGLCIVIPLIYWNRERFNHKVAALFIIANWIGPDSAQGFPFLPIDFHYLLPYLIWAVPLAFVFSYISRFDVLRNNRFFTIVDDEKYTLNWRDSYLLLVSAGILHTITDAIFRSNLKIKILENVLEPTLFDLHDIGDITGFANEATEIFALAILVISATLMLYIMKRSIRDITIFLGVLGFFVIFLVFTLGSAVVGEEFDVGILIFALAFIFAPLMLLIHVNKSVMQKQDNNSFDVPKRTSLVLLKLISGIIILLGIILVIIGLIAIIDPLVLQEAFNLDIFVFQILGVVFLIFAALMFVGGVGLLLKWRIARYPVMFVAFLLLILGYPLAIAFYLCQNNVRENLKGRG
jgi:hypothetical protein